ncbi:repressor of RNA polymerase III transcription Maf1 [Gorgonomyces haynaldii]|nr:repressor of RNA polymerase III transcription Maf1 [Gorgonomyces haynaldii]
MKFLQLEQLDTLNQQLSFIENSDSRMFARMEAYTIKSSHTDKKLLQYLEKKYSDQALSISLPSLSPHSPQLLEPLSTKTLFYLLSTLNCVYPDYDFQDLRPEEFQKVPSCQMAIHLIQQCLYSHFTDNMSNEIWTVLDEIVDTIDSEIYQFVPEPGREPDAEGNLSSVYLFFFNKKLKRVVFFTARTVRCFD